MKTEEIFLQSYLNCVQSGKVPSIDEIHALHNNAKEVSAEIERDREEERERDRVEEREKEEQERADELGILPICAECGIEPEAEQINMFLSRARCECPGKVGRARQKAKR